MDADFPRIKDRVSGSKDSVVSDKIGLDAYATEGWAISNRGWLATLTFSTLHATDIRFSGRDGKTITETGNRNKININLRAALGVDPLKRDSGWVELKAPDGKVSRITVVETGADTGEFRAEFTPGRSGSWSVSYGYWGFRKEALLKVK
jgi:hypothetical protein